MNFGTLKTRIQDVLGRTPNDVVYELVTSDVNNAIRVRSLRKEVRRHETDEIMMPADWKSVVSVKRNNVELTPTAQTGVAFEDEGTPRRYAMKEHSMLLTPRPGSTVHFEGKVTIGSGSGDGWRTASRFPEGTFATDIGSVAVEAPSIIGVTVVTTIVTITTVFSLHDIGETVYLRFGDTGSEWKFNRGAFSTSGGYWQYNVETYNGEGGSTLRTYFQARTGNTENMLISNTAGLNVGQGDIVITYYEDLADLSADTDTNDILTNYPQIYVYGALFHHHSLTQNAEAAQGYYQLYERAMNEAKKENNAALFGAGPVVPKVRSAP